MLECSPMISEQVPHPKLDISQCLPNFSTEISQGKNWYKWYKNLICIVNLCTNILGMSPKLFRTIPHPELDISQYLCNFSKKVSQITDWQTWKKFSIIWNKCTNILGMSPKNFNKMSPPELEISLYLSNFSKEVSQLTDWQTYKKFRIIWNYCRFIPGLSPENFRKKSYAELDISLYLSNFTKEVSQITDRQTY